MTVTGLQSKVDTLADLAGFSLPGTISSETGMVSVMSASWTSMATYGMVAPVLSVAVVPRDILMDVLYGWNG
jgi:hypothetical protein